MKTFRGGLRWAALIAGSGMALLFMMLFVGSAIEDGLGPPSELRTVEQLGFLAMFIMISGTLLAWRWGQAGGWLMVSGALAFVLIQSVSFSVIRLDWFAMVFMIAGLGVLIAEIGKENRHHRAA